MQAHDRAGALLGKVEQRRGAANSGTSRDNVMKGSGSQAQDSGDCGGSGAELGDGGEVNNGGNGGELEEQLRQEVEKAKAGEERLREKVTGLKEELRKQSGMKFWQERSRVIKKGASKQERIQTHWDRKTGGSELGQQQQGRTGGGMAVEEHLRRQLKGRTLEVAMWVSKAKEEEEGRKESQKELQRVKRATEERDGGDCGVHRATEEPGASAPGEGGGKVTLHRGASPLLEYVCGRQLEGVPVARGNGDNGNEWGRKGSGSQGAAGGVVWDVGATSWEQRLLEADWGRKGSQEGGIERMEVGRGV